MPIIEATFALIAAVVTYVLMPYIKSRITAEQQAQIAAWGKIAVTAAEQIYTGSGMGQAKKAYVNRCLSECGVTVHDEEIEAMIESAVYALKEVARDE